MNKILALGLCVLMVSFFGCQKITKPGAQQKAATLQRWVQHVDDTMSLSRETLEQRLKPMGSSKPEDTEQLLVYAVLNQQLGDRLGWIRARDSLRILSTHEELAGNVQALVGLLQYHNQQMINHDARKTRLLEELEHRQSQISGLEQALEKSRLQTVVLSEKIQALTTLEQNMSIRRSIDSSSRSATAPVRPEQP